MNLTLKETAENAERDAIIDSLNRNRWNRTKTAKELGIVLKTLLLKIKKYEIE